MKLRRLLAGLLVLSMVITGSPMIHATTTEDEPEQEAPIVTVEEPTQEEPAAPAADAEYQTLAATDTSYMLWSPAVGDNGNGYLEFNSRDAVKADKPHIDTLYTSAVGQFNDPGNEWGWFAYKLSVPSAGTYTLGVGINNCRNAPYYIPLCVNGAVYALSYGATGAQKATVEVTLPAGEHTVLMFMPMPLNEAGTNGDLWVVYPWCNVASVLVDSALTVSKAAVAEVEACFAPAVKEDAVISAVNTDIILLSATIKKNAAALGRTDQATLSADAPSIATLYKDAVGQFNKAGEEWNWFAFKVTVPAAGTYTLGVSTAGSKYASYQIPLCVNNTVYALSYTAKSQTVTTEVTLSAGEHTVVVFMPLPANKAAISGNAWNDYHWCDIQSVTVDGELTVSKPTVAEVEAVFEPKTLSAADSSFMLWSATVGSKEEPDGTFVLYCANSGHMRWDKPTAETIYTDAIGQFNAPGGEWNWFAYNVIAPAAGTYTLGVKVNNVNLTGHANIPLCVNDQVYTLKYTQAPQQVTVDVALTAGKNTVVMFMPMPEKRTSDIAGNGTYYPWCNVESMIVDRALTVSKPTVAEVEACFIPDDTVISVVNADYVLWSATVGAKKEGSTDVLYCVNQEHVRADSPYIDSLYSEAYGEFNAPGSEWNWFAFKVNASAVGTYTLGVKVNGCKFASYKIPMCINGEVYALTYSAKNQLITGEVALPAGETTVVLFMPMPQNAAASENNVWNDYPWCNVESLTVDYALTVSKPTVAEVEDCFAPVSIRASNDSLILLSEPLKTYAGDDYLQRGTDGARDDKPYIDSLYNDAPGEFNASGSEWSWFAYKLTVPAEGDYVLGLSTVDCKYASYKIPMCINRNTYILSYSAKTQQQTAQVHLTAGEHVVVLFMPMPQNTVGIDNNVWNDYPWCNVQDVIVGAGLKVTKPTVAEVEACFPDRTEGSVLTGQSVLFVGDSITQAAGSWASIIGNDYAMDWTNAGVSGATISDRKATIIRHQLVANAGKSYDYVIMHGGINDAGVAVGTVSSSWNVADFDTETYAGALETMFYYAYENYPGAKLGYIVNYATPNSDPVKWKGTQDMSAYFTVGKQVCEKWGISYIDLYFGKTDDGKSYSYDILQVDKASAVFLNNDPKEIHLSASGYRLISPYIADWMETIAPKNSPIPAANSGKYVDSGDTSTVLSGGFKVGAGILTDRVYTAMAEDGANIEILPYSRDMLGDWAFASIQVKAAEAGDYKFLVEMGAKTAAAMGMLVDGQVYTLNYTKKDGSYMYMAQTVHLEAGTHYITFTAAMPKTDNDMSGNAWDIYPWTNITSIIVDSGLEVLEKPTLEAVTSCLSVYTPFYNRVEAEDSRYVVYNNYNTTNESNAAASGGQVVGGAWNSTYQQTFEELEVWLDAKHNAYVEYAVIAPEDGEYDIRVGFLAGSNDKSVPKPYIAVIVNGKTHKVQFEKEWNQVDKHKLTVSLKKGLNIIRCTSFTTDQKIYSVKGWVNQDFLDLDKRLTPVTPSSVIVEAESSGFMNKFRVQRPEDFENASGYVIGNADRKYMVGLGLTLESISEATLVQVPYFSMTVTAPQDGYYPISVYMAGDGRMTSSTIGIVVDGQVIAAPYVRTDKSTAGARVDTLLYLTEGDHVIAFTCPMPANASVRGLYTCYWCNFDYVKLFNGLTYAKTQKMPATEVKYARLEAEKHAMFNMNGNNGTAVGNAYYKSIQSLTEMVKDGIDGGRTPYAEFTVLAESAGRYLVYLGVSSGMTQGSTWKEIYAQFAVEVNGKIETRTVYTTKTTNSTIVPLWLNLKEGENTIRLTHFSSDCQKVGTTWIDFDYFEMPHWSASALTFVETGETLEAEDNNYSGYSEFANASYSNGAYLGDADYNDIDESDVTFEKLNPADLGELPYVTYRVYAEKAGTYAVSVGFAAGMHKYLPDEIAEGTTAGFAVIVNGTSKQLVEYEISSSNTKMSRVILVDLQEGENEITVTCTLAEYIFDHVPYVEETYRKVWIDQDYLLLSGGLTGMDMAADDYDVDDSDVNHGQINPQEPPKQDDQETIRDDVSEAPPVESFRIPAMVWILGAAGVAAAMIILFVFLKRRKNQKKA